MFRKTILIIVMCMPLVGAAATDTPAPVLLVMGGLIILALSIAIRGEQQG